MASGSRMSRTQATVLAALAVNELRARDRPLWLSDAHALVTGEVGVCGADWERPELRTGVFRLLSTRHPRLATSSDFHDAARAFLAAGGAGCYASAPDEGRYRPVHSEHVASLVERVLADCAPTRRSGVNSIESLPARLAAPIGRGSGGEVAARLTVTLPEGFDLSPEPVLPLRMAAHASCSAIPIGGLLTLAKRLDDAGGVGGKRYTQTLRGLLGRLETEDGLPATELAVDSGGLQLLVAPTGMGKSALLVLLALYTAECGKTLAISVPDKRATLELVWEIERAAQILSRGISVAPLMSSDAHWEEVEDAIATPRRFDPEGRWTLDRLGYSCALSNGGSELIPPGREPCDSLVDADEPVSPSRAARVACPARGRCEKFATHREACAADVVVTNHFALIAGRLRARVDVGGDARTDLHIAELLAHRADLIVVDEVDQLQDAAVSLESQTLALADTRGGQPLGRLLAELENSLADHVIDPGWEGPFRKTLTRAAWLARQYLLLHIGAEIDGADGRLHLATEHDGALAELLGGSDDGPDLDRLCGIEPVVDEPRVEALRERVNAVVDQNDLGVSPAQAVVALNDALADWIDGADERSQATNALVHRVFRVALSATLSRLLQQLPGRPAEALPSAAEIESRLGWLRPLDVIPFGPFGRIVYGFTVSADGRRLSCSRFAGDPQRWVVQLGDTVSGALAGMRRPVLGLSATAYLPGAPVSHVPGRLRYLVPDSDDRQVAVHALSVPRDDGRLRRISGLSPARRGDAVRELGATLVQHHVRAELDRLAADAATTDRARILLVCSSYSESLQLARGVAAALGDAGRLRLVWSSSDDPAVRGLPVLHRRDLARFVETHADILIAPLATIARGYNIVLPDGRSALGAIYACVRALAPPDDPGLLLARVAAHAWAAVQPRLDGVAPGEAIRLLYSGAWGRLHRLARDNGPFATLPRELQRELATELLADLIQLIGRARRGGTSATLYLVDAAFHEGPASLPRLIADVVGRWRESGELALVSRTHAATLAAFARYADVPLAADLPAQSALSLAVGH
jgi:hypothetical protein